MVERQINKKKTISTPLRKSLYRLFSYLKEKIGQITRKKGSFKDPLLYLGLVSILFGLFSFGFSSILLGPLSQKGEIFYLKTSASLLGASEIFTEKPVQELFLSPGQDSPKESPDFLLVQRNSLQACASPSVVISKTLGVLDGSETELAENTRDEIIEYTVQPGDDLTSIAKQFGISLDTLLWANDLNKNAKIKVGQSLIILPVSGVLHYVQQGETIAGVAKRYKADPEKIIAFNNLTGDGRDILRGDILVISDGVMPPASNGATSGQPSLIPIPSSYFFYPVPSSYVITQRLHWFNAVDFGNGACGGPVYAAAGGEIQKTGRSRIGGNFIRILHPNGVVTYYGHLATILVTVGERVSQGQIIGYVGNSGYTVGITGCHLHFAVYGARNPFNR